MLYQAVIFDLFGTLVDNYPQQETNETLSEIAQILHVSPQQFISLWTVETWYLRATGVFPDLEASMEYICLLLQRRGVLPAQIEQACQLWLHSTMRTLIPREKVLDILQRLRLAGYKIGVMTDCSYETPFHWPTSAFPSFVDATVFSCLAGMKKPDPRMYDLTCQQLVVQPERCIYIGDGCGHELTGAAAVGMYPIHLHLGDESANSLRPDAEEWQGAKLSSLEHVFSFIENRSSCYCRLAGHSIRAPTGGGVAARNGK